MRIDFANRSFTHSLLASVVTGGALIFAFPCFDRSEIAWVALIPLAIVALRNGPMASAVWGYVSGAVFFLGSLYWLIHVTLVGWIVLSLFLALYFAFWGWFVSAVNIRLGPVAVITNLRRNLLLAFLASCGWVCAEIVRTHLFTGFPWNLLGVSQYRNLPLIQFTTVTGVYGVSWLICFINMCLALTALRLKSEFYTARDRSYKPHFELTLALIVVVVVMLLGFRSVGNLGTDAKGWHKLDVALVQPNIPQTEKWDEKSNEIIYDRFAKLTEGAIHTKPDLIVWPETATPEPLEYDAKAFAIITNAVKRSGAYLLTGSMAVTRNTPRSQSDPNSTDRVWYNSAYVVSPKGELQGPYNKQHLVPFGEFIPFEKKLPFMKFTTPIPGSFGRGREHTLFELRDAVNMFPPAKLGVVICFEDVFPDVFRRFVLKGAQLMVNVTNDAWYKESAGAYQHMALSVFRAVENRVYFVRCANTGYSCFIEPTGRIKAHITGGEKERIFVQGFRTERVSIRPATEAQTFYTKHGDAFAWTCFGIAMAAMLASIKKLRALRRFEKAQAAGTSAPVAP